MKIAKRSRVEEIEFNLIGKGCCFWDRDELFIKTEEGIAFFKDSRSSVNAVRLRDGMFMSYTNNYTVIPENREEVIFNRK